MENETNGTEVGKPNALGTLVQDPAFWLSIVTAGITVLTVTKTILTGMADCKEDASTNGSNPTK